MSMFNNVVQLFTGEIDIPEPVAKKHVSLPKFTERDLLRMESSIGRELFGPVPEDHQREFFCFDDRTWIWYEHWTDPNTKKSHESTIRYEIHSNGVIKIQDGHPYKVLEGEELQNLEIAMKIYHDRVKEEIYDKEFERLQAAATSMTAA